MCSGALPESPEDGGTLDQIWDSSKWQTRFHSGGQGGQGEGANLARTGLQANLHPVALTLSRQEAPGITDPQSRAGTSAAAVQPPCSTEKLCPTNIQ